MDEAGQRDTVRRIARAGDPDRTLAALFAPREARDDLFALYAVNVELARIAEQVSEPDVGAIRLQWWREAIERASKGETTGHPVADAFGTTLRRRGLPPERIAALIDARGFDIAERIMPDRSSLDAYLRDTSGGLFALAAHILGASGPSLPQAIEAAGRAYGLTGLMRSLPMNAAQGRVHLPADALIAHGTSPERVLAGTAGNGLQSLLAELRGEAKGALTEAVTHIGTLDVSARTALLPLCLVEPYIVALAKSSRDPLREIAGINPLYRLWRMARWR